ncbi:hypothetical protein BHYA_0075g00470 [Botrytis hyacinthi]|uniref:Uncharacterized protein n=1 Tax=Botrytis hyacinthi TaxID=278943 RepID=A0A4Z1GYQ5_9HELO|nr:hypothetical protein BHYA_0075g00470 [Botrytis hyacinthi]
MQHESRNTLTKIKFSTAAQDAKWEPAKVWSFCSSARLILCRPTRPDDTSRQALLLLVPKNSQELVLATMPNDSRKLLKHDSGQLTSVMTASGLVMNLDTKIATASDERLCNLRVAGGYHDRYVTA